MTQGRVKVACINWTYADAPRAVSYVLVDGDMVADRYHATWGEAMDRANLLALHLAGSRAPAAAAA